MVPPQRATAAAPPAEPALQIMAPIMMMTSNRARHELIQLPTISVKVRLLGTRQQSGTVPGTVPRADLPGDGDAPPSPSPICLGRRGRFPVPDSHRGVRALSLSQKLVLSYDGSKLNDHFSPKRRTMIRSPRSHPEVRGGARRNWASGDSATPSARAQPPGGPGG